MRITYFVHGTTIDNETGLATGWAGGELSELGVKQAKDLGGLVVDWLLTSILMWFFVRI